MARAMQFYNSSKDERGRKRVPVIEVRLSSSFVSRCSACQKIRGDCTPKFASHFAYRGRRWSSLFATSGNEDNRHMHALGPPVRHRTRALGWRAKLLPPHARRFFSTSRLPKHLTPSFTSFSAALPLDSSTELVARGRITISFFEPHIPRPHISDGFIIHYAHNNH